MAQWPKAHIWDQGNDCDSADDGYDIYGDGNDY